MGEMQSAQAERYAPLDAVRGFTVASMLIVNATLDPRYCWEPFSHAPWNGYNFADLGLPAFIFFMGAALAFSVARDRANGRGDGAILLKNARRGLYIILAGWVLSAFPFGLETFWSGAPGAAFWPAFSERIIQLKITGILPHLGFVYIISGALFCYLKSAGRLAAAIILIAGAHAALLAALSPHPMTTNNNWAFTLDQAILGAHGMPVEETDPDGLAAMIASIATALAGAVAGLHLHSGAAKPGIFFMIGALLVAVAHVFQTILPINKTLWSLTFNIVSAGWTCVAMSIAILLMEWRLIRTLANPIVILGRRSLAAFVVVELLTILFVYIRIPSGPDASVALVTYLFEQKLDWIHNPLIRSHAGGTFLGIVIATLILLYDHFAGRRTSSRHAAEVPTR